MEVKMRMMWGHRSKNRLSELQNARSWTPT